MAGLSSPIVRCLNLHKTFFFRGNRGPSLHVLKGINLEIFPGEMVSIVGASGAGKSTLLHILGGLDRPTEGKVFWREKDIFDLHDNELPRLRSKEVGFVFQFHHLLPEFTALENVALPAMIAGASFDAAEGRAMDLLVKVGLVDRVDHTPNELSGGEQQRVAVARALVNNPAVVLADEPSGNLDSVNAGELHDLLVRLNKEHKQTFVMVTHNEKFSERSHRVFRMWDGNLKQR